MQENKVLFDTHVHLNNDFYAKDIENHIKEMITQGIKKMLCVGYDIPSSNKAISLSKKYPNLIYAAVGIHPTTLENHNQESLDQLELLLQKPEVYALGEIGLDYHWDSVEPMLQKRIFY